MLPPKALDDFVTARLCYEFKYKWDYAEGLELSKRAKLMAYLAVKSDIESGN